MVRHSKDLVQLGLSVLLVLAMNDSKPHYGLAERHSERGAVTRLGA